MPTYDYECEKCKKGFELVQSMKDPALATCPQESCRMRAWGRGKVRRLLGTGAGLIFKGSGFYITDYRSEGYKASEKKESAAGESKPAEKAGGEAKPAESKPASESKPAGESTPAKSKPASGEQAASKKK